MDRGIKKHEERYKKISDRAKELRDIYKNKNVVVKKLEKEFGYSRSTIYRGLKFNKK